MKPRHHMALAFYLGVVLVALVCVWYFLSGCTIRKYEVKVYAVEGSHVTISPEILAEVPHTTTVESNAEAEIDLPDANVIGK